MNFKFWKKKNEVIKQESYDKPPSHHQTNYLPSHE